MVAYVLGYASEIWGSNCGHDIEVIHNRLCRHVLKVGRSTNGELGHYPMYVMRQFRIL